MAEHQDSRDQDAGKGAVEDNERSNTSLAGQNPHRPQEPLLKDQDTDFPEPGGSPEHSGEAVEGFTRDRHGRAHQDTGVTRRGSTLSHQAPGAVNQNSNAPGLRAPAAQQQIKQRADRSPEREEVNQDPGQRQKETHNQEKDDPLAA